MNDKKAEVWMRGPIANVPPHLQPVAHAILQALEEVQLYTKDFPDTLLWIKPGGLASVGFHLQHLRGILDRLFSYAKSKPLSDHQLEYLKHEGIPSNDTTQTLVKKFEEQVDLALQQLKNTNEDTLLETRGIGRKQIPTTVQGLLFHAAEHTQRHVGQLLVTIRLLPFIDPHALSNTDPTTYR